MCDCFDISNNIYHVDNKIIWNVASLTEKLQIFFKLLIFVIGSAFPAGCPNILFGSIALTDH